MTPQRLRFEMHRADRFLVDGRFQEALEPLGFITAIVPTHAGAWLMTSKALSGLSRDAEAREAAERAVQLLEKEPKDRRAAWQPGVFYLRLGQARAKAADLPGAEQALRRADKEQPDSADILRELGSALLRLGSDAEAAATLRRAVALDPKSARSQVELGNALVRTGDLDGATAAFRAAAELAPTEPEPHYGLSTVAGARKDDAAQAAELATFEKLSKERDARIEASRKLDDTLRAAGDAMRDGRFKEAAATFEAALSDPLVTSTGYKKQALLLDLARSRARAGDVRGARTAYEDLLKADDRAPSGHLELGNLLAGQGLVDEAFPHLLRAVELDPLEVAPHASLAMLWATLGRLDDAMDETAKASLLDPNDMAMRQQYVDLLAAGGRTDEARELAKAGGVNPPGALKASVGDGAPPAPATAAPAAVAPAPGGPPANVPADVPIEGPAPLRDKEQP